MSRAEQLFEKLTVQGEAAIDQLIADFQSENLWLDFKRSADNGSGTKLAIGDRENLARAISGFGNSDGGVIVWGIDCRRDSRTGADVPHAKVPIVHPERFVSWLENVITSCTAPPHQTVESRAISGVNSADGFVVTLIPSSVNAPHQCIQPTSDARYYIRTGSNFSTVPHAVLSGLFGRRPQPRVATKWLAPTLRLNGNIAVVAATISLTNSGRAIARDLFLNFWAFPPGPNCRVSLTPPNTDKWEQYQLMNLWNIISRESYRLAPGANAPIAMYELHLLPPFDATYSLDLGYGCEGAERRQDRTDIAPKDIDAVYSQALDTVHQGGVGLPILKTLLGGA